MEIGNIVKGHANELFNLNQNLSKSRMQICKKCPLFKDIVGGLCNPKLWMNPITKEVSTEKRDGFFKGCGCRLLAKTTLTNASCPVKQW